jgi:signal transduction histidine kinase/CheY-like chemotaxis protein
MRLSSRLLLWFSALALIPLALGALLVMTAAERTTRDAVFTALTLAADNQVSKIETYVIERQRAVSTLARTPTIIGAVRRLRNNIGSAQNDSLSASTRPFLEYIAARSGYLDVILIDTNGTILNTLTDSVGGHIRDAARISPQLARVFDTVRTLGTTEISDFSLVLGRSTPVAYIAAPVVENGILIGIVAFQLDNREFARVIQDRTGLGQTGETVIGIRDTDRAVVITPLRFDPNAAFQQAFRFGDPRALGLQQAVNGVEGFGEQLDYRGVNTVAVWRYAPSLRWGLVVKMDASEAFAARDFQRTAFGTLFALTVGVVIAASIVGARSITQPLERLTDAVRAFSGGDLAARAGNSVGARRDEIGVLASGFDVMAAQIADQVTFLEARVAERTQQISEYAARMDAARQDAENAQYAAERANQSKTIFLTSMSHELRTPLNAILGFAQVMDRDATLNAKQHDHVGIIMRSGEHLLGLINDVLEMSKIEAGQVTLNESTFDLHELLRGIEEMMQVRANAKGLQLLFELEEDIPRYVRTDEGKLRQILLNIIGNGLKFTKEGGVAVRVARKVDAAVPTLIMEIDDTGHGIAPNEIEALFQPFVQSESGRKHQEGTGLGLALSRQFARLMGGDITLNSTLGDGTTFSITLQYTEASASDLPTYQTARRVRGIDPTDTRDYRILVVDDKIENRLLMQTWLTTVGLTVREAANGKEAVEIWERWEPQLIWMDMRMPIMNGYEATKYIKASDKGSATIIIALTASALDAEKNAIMMAGCDDFVRKPTRESIIMDKLVEHLGIKFIYDDHANGSGDAAVDSAALTAASYATLPDAWRAAFQEAADRLDVEACSALIDTLRASQPAMAATLGAWLAAFRFDKLHALFAQPTAPLTA